MAAPVQIEGIHHLRLTVTDVERSRRFYTELLGFEIAAESPPKGSPEYEQAYPVLWGGIVMVKGSLLMGLRPVAPAGDRFTEDRVGLDHLSFKVADRGVLETMVEELDRRGVEHGPITPLQGFGIYILPFRDPDNIQVELTAPM